VNWNELVAKFSSTLKQHSVNLAASGFIALVVAGSLVSASCAHTPDGLAREQALYHTATNAVASAQSITPYVPAPLNSALDGVLAAGAALLALWATHLQRSVKELRNSNGSSQASSSPATPPTVPSAPTKA
jgi:hypothetical protein